MNHDSPISTHGKGPTLAKLAVQDSGGHWPVPEGTILAPLWKRISAFMLDIYPKNKTDSIIVII